MNLSYGIKDIEIDINGEKKAVDLIVSQPMLNVRPELYYLGGGMKFKKLGFGEDQLKFIADVNDQFLENTLSLLIEQNFSVFDTAREYDPLDVID